MNVTIYIICDCTSVQNERSWEANRAISVRVCVSDINNAQVRYYEQWNIIDIITASCSIPWLFKPVLYEWYYLIDGGIFDNFPVPLDKNIPIIGHHVNPRSTTKCRNTKEIVARSLDLLVSRDIQTQSKLCTIFLEPPKLSSIQQSDMMCKCSKIDKRFLM